MFNLERAWNCNMRLRAAVRRAAMDGISKATVVKFWKASARKLGYWGSYKIPKVAKNPYYADQPEVHTEYTDWKGTTGPGRLLLDILHAEKNGEPK